MNGDDHGGRRPPAELAHPQLSGGGRGPHAVAEEHDVPVATIAVTLVANSSAD
jgi:hypothetical protein